MLDQKTNLNKCWNNWNNIKYVHQMKLDNNSNAIWEAFKIVEIKPHFPKYPIAHQRKGKLENIFSWLKQTYTMPKNIAYN